MKLYELSLHKSSANNLEDFESQIEELRSSDSLKMKQLISKLYFEIPNINIGIPASTFRHDKKKHTLSTGEWKNLIKNINNPLLYVEARKSKAFRGENYLYKYKIYNKFYGVAVCKTKIGWLITTFFEDKESNIDNWLLGNGKAQPKVPTAAYVPGCSLSEGLNNIITNIKENVNPFDANKIYYHGSNSKFTTFDKSKIKENKLGLCFNFTDDYSMAYQYGDNILKVHLDLNNPLTKEIFNTKWTYEQDNMLAKKLGFPGINKEDFDDTETFGDVYEIFKMDPRFIELLEEMGYDGIAFPEEHHYGVFEPEQIHVIQNEQLAYHGSREKFDKFDLNKFQRGDYGYGIYFTRSKSYAGDYGDVRQYEIPDNEYLLDWESTWQYQSDYVYDCLDKLFDDLYDNDRDNWEKIMEIVDRGYGNDGEGLYMNLSEILKLSSKQTSELLYKYGIKGIDSFKGNCQVIFNPEDIKMLVTENFKSLNEQLQKYL